jgi:hypothetical protein
MRVGDTIMAIDGKDIKDTATNDVSALLKGEPGSKLQLKYKRPGIYPCVCVPVCERARICILIHTHAHMRTHTHTCIRAHMCVMLYGASLIFFLFFLL